MWLYWLIGEVSPSKKGIVERQTCVSGSFWDAPLLRIAAKMGGGDEDWQDHGRAMQKNNILAQLCPVQSFMLKFFYEISLEAKWLEN